MMPGEPETEEPANESSAGVRLGKWFVGGLVAVVPLVATLWLVVVLYGVLKRAGAKLVGGACRSLETLFGWEGAAAWGTWEFAGAGLVYFAVPVGLLLAVGLAAASGPGRGVMRVVDGGMGRLPVVGYLYFAIKQFVDSVRELCGGERKFKSVAYVEYPVAGNRLVGFVTGNFHDEQTGRDVTSVFIPTSPNPMTGFVMIVDDEKVMPSEMSLEEATKMILSAGLVSPKQMRREMEHSED